MRWIVILLLMPTLVFAKCIEPADGMFIKESTLFCSSTYDLPSGITIAADNIELDCGTAILRPLR